MSDANESDAELERIRERKRERLRERIEQEQDQGPDGTDSSDIPTDPLHVESPSHLSELLERYSLVLVDFYADWCGPCQMLAPILETVAGETPAAIAKVDTDAQPELAQQYGVQGLPTLVLFADGEPVDRLVGMQDETTLRQRIDRHARS